MSRFAAARTPLAYMCSYSVVAAIFGYLVSAIRFATGASGAAGPFRGAIVIAVAGGICAIGCGFVAATQLARPPLIERPGLVCAALPLLVGPAVALLLPLLL